MEIQELHSKLINDLTNEYISKHTKEELDDLKYNFENMFYKDYKNKYLFEVDQYIKLNFFDYLKNYYDEANVSSEDQIQIFKCYMRTEYKYYLYKDKEILLPQDFDDEDLIEDCCCSNDYRIISHILYLCKDNSQPFEKITNNVFYMRLSAWAKRNVLKYYSYIIDEPDFVFNKIFDDMCNSDTYYDILDYLKKEVTYFTSENIYSLIKYMSNNGVMQPHGNEKFNMATAILEKIENKDVKLCLNNESLNLDILRQISASDNPDGLVNEIIDDYSFTNGKLKSKKLS